MNIALFGGTFDPPHVGHQQVAQYLVDSKTVDQVWYVPVFQHPWQAQLGKQMSEYAHRLAMLHLLEKIPQIQVAEYRDVSFTLDQLVYFKNKFPEHTFIWVMGSEYLPKFDAFLATHPRLIDHPMVIYPRAGYPHSPVYPNMHLLDGCPEVELSSTHIRQMVKKKKSIRGLVADAVQSYIQKEKLYL